MKLLKVSLLAIFAFFATSYDARSQSEWKTWDAMHFSVGITKKLSTKLVYLKSFNMTNNWKNEFNQATWQTDYDFNKRFSVRASLVSNFSTDTAEYTTRFLVRGTYTKRIAKKFNWSNALQLELHSANETRYRNRIIYVTRFAPVKRLKFLKLAPSISYMLYYNIGGNPIQYYDETGLIKTVRQSPDGFHRGRLIINLNSKITKSISLSLYYMNQKEFNFLVPADRKMNYVRPGRTTVYRAFDNYNVIGLSLMYNINLYKSKKTSKSVRNATSQKDDNLRRDL
jgi:hypothetical protein